MIRVKILIEACNQAEFENICLKLPDYAFSGPQPVINVCGTDGTVVMRPLRDGESSWVTNAYNLP